MPILSWTDVVRLHQTNEGIGAHNGIAASLICNVGKGAKYPNAIGDGWISYVVGPKTKKESVDALRRAQSLASPVRVFTKRATDQWEDLGPYVVVAVEAKADGVFTFRLERAASR